jgi:hypothetical protein
MAIQQYENKALANVQVKVQPKTSVYYRTITKALAETHMECHTFELKEERSY